MARPRKSSEVRLTRQVAFRLNNKDYAPLEADAKRAGIHPNELARRLTKKRKGRLIIKTSHRCDPAYIAQVKAIGVNLNQLAKNSHIFGRVTPKLDELCDEIRRVVLEAVEDDLK